MTNTAANIQLHITFKNTAGTDAIKNYATEKITHCIEKFVHRAAEARVVLSVERNRQLAEVSLHNDGIQFIAKEESGDLYASIDALVDTLTAQLRKHKEKLTKHH